MGFRPFSLVVLLGLVIGPLTASAKLCGDDVQGRDVPCECGDIVVSDLILDNDPVLNVPCARDGLVVRALDAPQAVTIDLRGHTIRGGKHGAGLKILHGGPGGARIVSSTGPAAVQGFEDGIFAHSAGSVALIENVIVSQNKRDGIRVTGANYEIRNTEVHGAGRDGFSLAGSGFTISGTRAVGTKRSGYFIMGQNGALGLPGAPVVAEASGEFGFNLMGMNHKLSDCVATGAERDGIMIMGSHIEIRACTVTGNGGNGIGGMGSDVLLVGNRALNNAGHGIYVDGPDTRDGGGNSGRGNLGIGANGPVVDCQIHRLPCFL